MTDQQAHSKGLSFTGIYERNKAQVNESLENLRKKYSDCKFYIVTKPDSKYSRGTIGKGWSIYADKKFLAYGELEYVQEQINGHATRLGNLKKKYDIAVLEEMELLYKAEDRKLKALQIISKKD
jgi:hypothetical protein